MTQYEEMRNTASNVYDGVEQGLINMQVDLCLINLVTNYGQEVRGFDLNAQDTAVARSLDFMGGYIQEFEEYFQYLKSSEHIKYRYGEMARKAQEQAEELVTQMHVVEESAC